MRMDEPQILPVPRFAPGAFKGRRRRPMALITKLTQSAAGPTAGELADLLQAVADTRDRSAFATLFGYFAPRVKAFLVRGGVSPGLAEELAQETLVRVWYKAGTFDRGKAAVSTWVYTIARNLRVDALRRGGEDGIEAPAGALDDQAADETATVFECVASAELAAGVRAAIGRLPPEQREVLRLSFYESEPHAAIARTLAIPVGTVKSRIRLAVGRLRQLLDPLRS
jgi:RNA polymerase sigma-70 factor (ECF subfamily)